MKLARVLLPVQGLYYVMSGMWPLLSITSFQDVTGPKTDLWLVRTVGLLVTVTGAVLLSAFFRKNLSAEVVFLGMGTAGALACVDFIYVFSATIPRIYLLDGIAEAVLTVLWFLVWSRRMKWE